MQSSLDATTLIAALDVSEIFVFLVSEGYFAVPPEFVQERCLPPLTSPQNVEMAFCGHNHYPDVVIRTTPKDICVSKQDLIVMRILFYRNKELNSYKKSVNGRWK